MSDIVWGDPSGSSHCVFRENLRGSGYLFNYEAVKIFLNNNSLKRIVRAHECIRNGIQCIFDDKCITVFSASSYDENIKNCSGISELFKQDDRVVVKSFPPIERLQKSDTVYYKVQNQNQIEKLPFSLLYPFLNVNAPRKLSKNMKIKHGKARNSYNSIISAKPSMFFKPSFTTKTRKSLNVQQSSSNANIQPSQSTKVPKNNGHRTLVVSQSMPNLV